MFSYDKASRRSTYVDALMMMMTSMMMMMMVLMMTTEILLSSLLGVTVRRAFPISKIKCYFDCCWRSQADISRRCRSLSVPAIDCSLYDTYRVVGSDALGCSNAHTSRILDAAVTIGAGTVELAWARAPFKIFLTAGHWGTTQIYRGNLCCRKVNSMPMHAC